MVAETVKNLLALKHQQDVLKFKPSVKRNILSHFILFAFYFQERSLTLPPAMRTKAVSAGALASASYSLALFSIAF